MKQKNHHTKKKKIDEDEENYGSAIREGAAESGEGCEE